MSFASDLASFRKKTGLKMDRFCQETTFHLFRDVVFATPVGDPTFWKQAPPPGYTGGHARANWQIGIGVAPSGEIQGVDKSGGSTIAAALPTIQQFGAGKVAYIVNNAPYIMELEYGHSQRQAPQGMARIAVNRWQIHVDKAVRSVQ